MTREAYTTGKVMVYLVVYSQCTEAMKAKLETKYTFENIATQSNVISLLCLIRAPIINE